MYIQSIYLYKYCDASRKKKFRTTFPAGGLVYFPLYQQLFIYIYCFSRFFSLLFSGIKCSFEQNTRKLVVHLRNLSDHNNFFTLLHFWGHVFRCP